MMNILLIELISLWYAVMILGLKKKKTSRRENS